MTFLADFHVHSRFSRATSKNLDLERLFIAAQRKGITVVGTGDATHPGWFAEIRDNLVPDETGLLTLKHDLQAACGADVPANCRSDVRFLLVSEISNIYKKNGKTRKNHNLVFLPGLEAAERFNRRLDAIGNIHSDGRPILGLDARDLLEIVLETDDRAFLIPAHIWTPWFSLLGSKSGFDSLEECFEDLSGHIFAAETGLSSDPAMNRLVSSLDRLTLVSNSDAHSPSKLAREANIFHCSPGYDTIRHALENPLKGEFGGTIEFYPEEGKYHLDGHRKCGVRLTPEETRELEGRCPVCSRPLTVGVYSRVRALADRTPEAIPPGQPAFENLIPLPEILSEVLQVGVNTKAVARAYAWALESLGNELFILREAAPEQIDVTGIPLLGEAIRRMRDGKLDIQAGYDGEFGRIRIFSDTEKRELLGQRRLFAAADSARSQGSATGRRGNGKKTDRSTTPKAAVNPTAAEDVSPPAMAGANPEQQQAIDYAEGPLLIVAGPGTGKTYTLTRRIAHLIQERGIPPEDMLAVTFTEKAADEMRTRLIHLLDHSAITPLTATFHGLCWRLLREDHTDPSFRILDNEERLFMLERVLRRLAGEGHSVTLKPKAILKRIVDAKQQLQGPHDYVEAVAPDASLSQFCRAYRAYQQLLEDRQLLDFEDLIYMVAQRLATDPTFRDKCRKRFRYVFVDEYQDLNYGQYRLIRELVPPEGNLCVIGDPDQAIYGFRGSDVAFFNRFVEDYPSAAVMHLTRNYRSVETILAASWQVIRQREAQTSGIGVLGSRLYSRLQGAPQVTVVALPSAKAEAVAVGQTIERAVGGAGFLAIDAGKVDASAEHDSSFADFAVLYRTAAQADILAAVFDKAGIPYQVASRRRYYEQPLTAAILAVLRVAAHTATPGDIHRMTVILEPSPDKETVMSMLDHMDALGLTPRQLLDETDPSRLKDLSRSRRRRLGETLSDWRQLMAGLESLSLEEQIGFLANRSVHAADDTHANRHAVERLLTYAGGCNGDQERFLETIALQADADMVQARVEKVTLTTMHAAKGLEFPVVFVVGCEDGLIPLRSNGRPPEDPDEERRLFYVALTRAREQLYLTWARKRRIFGRPEKRIISPFVSDIAQKLLKHQAPRLAKNPGPQQIQLKLF